MTLYELTRVDDNKTPAVVGFNKPTDYDRIYSVEPGDATHYTVVVSGSMAAAWVDRFPALANESDRGRVFSMLRTGDDTAIGLALARGATDYTCEVLTYFCQLALGIPCVEPAGLAGRREHAHQKG